MTLPNELSFIHPGEIWAFTGEDNYSTLVNSIQGKHIENVLQKHNFRNLSNTRDFYYQQRFNSSDSEDALTVQDHLASIENTGAGYWTTRKVIELLHLENLLTEQIIKLSNGETKRLLIASALIKNPQLITLDHPLTGLDTSTRKEFGNILKTITTSGITVILSTNPLEIPDGVTHVAVIKENEIIFHDRKEKYKPSDFNFDKEITIDRQRLKDLLTHHTLNNYSIIIQMKNVTVEYDGKKILHNINWLVKQGERWSLSGHNGAGKSTLLSLVNGDNPQAYANDIILFDRKRGSGESIWDIKKQTGYVSPELYQYFPTDSSCLHVIESGFYDTIGLFRPADPEKEQICKSWMTLMNIQQYAHRLFSMVPTSAQRLCLLARALVKNPTLLILDEPTQGLEISQQRFFTNLIDEYCLFSSVTVIYVSHYEHHIPKAVDKHIRLVNGKSG
ncbi:MAG: ATP-binding cassette domain-containing protein [Chitinophagaceae bacterium]|nr:ATP-binding cassette domain-containing protein [Chitinophagaceae bacterium]